MKRFATSTCITILFLVALQTSSKAQREFVDSIRSMLLDLDSGIQCAPINKQLQHAIPFCTGDTINDSLSIALKQIISYECVFAEGLLQPVSSHVLQKHVPLILHISRYLVQTGTPADYNLNMLNLAITNIKFAWGDKAAQHFNQSREILSQLQFAQPFLEAKRLRYLASTYPAYKPDSFYILLRQSLRQNPKKTHEEKVLYAETLYQLANFCRGNNKTDTALLLFQQLLDSTKQMFNNRSTDYVYWLLQTVDSYTYMAKYSPALELGLKAQEITRNTIGEATNQYALCLYEIGGVYYRTGEYAKALPYTQQALSIKRKIFGNDYFDNVVSLHDLAMLYNRMGLYNEAIPLLQESLAISKKCFGEGVVFAFGLHPLAEAYEYLGDYDKALPLYQKAVQIQQHLQKGSSGSNFYYPRYLHSIASLYVKLGQYDKAIELFIHALELKKGFFGEINPEYTRTLNSYAEACLLKGNYRKALSLQLESLSISKKLFGDIHPNIATGYYTLSRLYYQQGDMKKAETACDQALQMQKKIFGEKHPDIAASYDMLGNINKQMRRYEAALDHYMQAYEIRKDAMTSVHPDYIASMYNIGSIYLKKGRTMEAAQLFMQADSATLLNMEQSYSTLSEEEKLIYLQNSERQFQYLPSLLYLNKTNSPEIVNRVYNDALGLKGMILFHQQQIYNSIRKSNDSSALQLYHFWRYYKMLLGQQILLPPEKRGHDFDSLQEVSTQMEEQLSRISASFRNNTAHIDVKRIANHLSKEEAAIEFIRFRLYNNKWTDSIIYAALVLLPGKNNAMFVPLCEEKQLQQLLRFANNSGEAAVNYLYPGAGKETKVSNTLYGLVWKPLHSMLDGVSVIYYSPTGLLYRLSFAALHAGSGTLLTDKYRLNQLLCTRSLAWFTENKKGFSAAVLWGNINYDNAVIADQNISARFGAKNIPLYPAPSLQRALNEDDSTGLWQSLPGTKKEIENIFSLFKEKKISCKLETESAATEAQFKEMDGNSPGLLHVATHGFFLPQTNIASTNNYYRYESNSFSLQQNPMFRSGLLLAGANKAWSGDSVNSNMEDGVLTAYEISQLDLSNTQLATLSACQTALGDIKDNEGVFGLQRAFKMAGAKQVLMSLWKVPDRETTELMILFYTSFLEGDDANTALRKAQLEMKKKYSCYYWAGFVLSE